MKTVTFVPRSAWTILFMALVGLILFSSLFSSCGQAPTTQAKALWVASGSQGLYVERADGSVSTLATGMPRHAVPVAFNGNAYAVMGDSLEALSLNGGEVVWSVSMQVFGGTSLNDAQLLLAGEQLVLWYSQGVWVLNPATGKVVWKEESKVGQVAKVMGSKTSLYILSSGLHSSGLRIVDLKGLNKPNDYQAVPFPVEGDLSEMVLGNGGEVLVLDSPSSSPSSCPAGICQLTRARLITGGGVLNVPLGGGQVKGWGSWSEGFLIASASDGSSTLTLFEVLANGQEKALGLPGVFDFGLGKEDAYYLGGHNPTLYRVDLRTLEENSLDTIKWPYPNGYSYEIVGVGNDGGILVDEVTASPVLQNHYGLIGKDGRLRLLQECVEGLVAVQGGKVVCVIISGSDPQQTTLLQYDPAGTGKPEQKWTIPGITGLDYIVAAS